MPGPIPTPEIVARSMGEPPPGPPTPEQVLAKSLKERYAKKRMEDPLKALEPESTRQPLSINVDGEIARRIDRDPVLANRARSEANLIQAVVEGRPLSAPDRTALVDGLTSRVIDRYPAFRGLDPDQKRSVMDELIDNPRYQEVVQGLLAGRLNPDEVVEDVRLSEVTRALNEAQAALDEKVNSQVAATKGLDRIQAQTKLDEFQESPGGTAGTKGDEIKKLEANEQTQRRTIQNFERALERSLSAGKTNEIQIEQTEDAMRTKIASGEPITDPEQRLWSAYIRAKDNMQQLDLLRTEKGSYENRIKEIDEIAQLEGRRDSAASTYLAVKQRQEEGVVAKLETVLRDGADEVLKAEMKEKLLIQQTLDSENEAKAKTDDEKRLLAESKRQWEQSKRKGGRETSEINKRNVRAAFGRVMVDGTPDKEIEAYLVADLDRRMTPGTPEHTAELARIQRLASDKNFMDTVRPQFVKGLTTRYLLSGGKVSKDEIRLLRETDWGKTAIMSAVEDNKALMEEIRKVYGEGALGGFMDKLKHMSDGNFLKFLLLLLGTMTLIVPLGMKASGTLGEGKF